MTTRAKKRKTKCTAPVLEQRNALKRGTKPRTGKAALVRVTIRFDSEEAAKLRLLVAREGRASVSEFIRARVLMSDSA